MLARDTLLLLALAISGCGTATTLEDGGSDAGDDGGHDVGMPPTCRHQSECDASLVCIAGLCRPETPCSSSRMCPGFVCNTFLGHCVECSMDIDCGSAGRCQGHVCSRAVACMSDRECSSNGEICDTSTGFCAECASDVDCDAAHFCGPDGGCALDVCMPGVAMCVGAGAAMCLLNGSGPGAVTPCPAGCTDGLCAPVPDAGPDAGHDAGIDGGHDAGTPPVWEMISVGGLVQHPGWTDATPAGGGDVFYAVTGDTTPQLARFDGPTRTWTPLTAPSPAFSRPAYFAGLAWVGGSLYLVNDTSVQRYDIASASWSSPVGISTSTWSQSAHDESGHVFAVTDDNRIATYTVATNTVSYQVFGRDAPVTGARLVWDPSTQLLYVAPNIALATMYAFDPATGNITVRRSLPATRFTPTFCGDRHGRIYAAGDNNGMFLSVYEIATDTWSTLSPTLPFDHNANGACTVTDDGYLYYTDVGNNLARLRVR